MKPISILSAQCLLLLGMVLHTQAQQVYISPGLYVIAADAPQLVFSNTGLSNHGNFTAANSTVTFTGSANTRPVLINGDRLTTFHQLVIRRDVQLGQAIGVTGHLYLQQGNLQLEHYSLDLGHSGTIMGERNESRITGRPGSMVTRTATLHAPRNTNPGNIGVAITSEANLGKTVITRGHASPLPGTTATAVNRYFDIAPAFNNNLNATLQFHYFDAELSGNENELTLFAGDNQGWKRIGKDNSNTAVNWLTKNNLEQLHRYTLAGSRVKGTRESASETVQVYPNPVKDRFTVRLPASSQQAIALLLLNSAGQVIERKKVNTGLYSNTVEWNISHYPAGSYQLMIEGGIQANAIKIMKE